MTPLQYRLQLAAQFIIAAFFSAGAYIVFHGAPDGAIGTLAWGM